MSYITLPKDSPYPKGADYLKEYNKYDPNRAEPPFPGEVPIKKDDMVNSPPHYGQGKIECIDYIRDFLSEDEYIGYLRGNIAKYLHRWRYKNGVEDLKKAEWYQKELVRFMEAER